MAIRLSGMVSGLDTDSIVKELVSAYSTKKDNLVKAQTKLEWKQEAWKSLNTKIYSFYSKSLSEMRYVTNYSQKATSVSDTTKASVTAGSSTQVGTQTLEINKLAKSGYLTGGVLSTVDGTAVTGSTKLSNLGVTSSSSLNVTIDGTTTGVDITADTTVSQLITNLKAAGVNASFDSTNQRIFVSSKKSGEDNDFTLSGSGIDGLGLTTSDAVKTNGQDAQITLNGAVFTSTTNTFNINGLTIQAKAETEAGSELSVTTSVDTDKIYDMIKDFVSGYNTLVNEMDSLYNADSAKGYEPLTDDEKDAMTDTEVEKWETKIKDALLRRDQTLDTVSGSMKTAMDKTYTYNGKNYSLASFGIGRLSYFVSATNEKNAYHIDGNEDDSSVSSNTDKLKAAIESDPDAVASFFTSLAKGVYSTLDAKMKSTTLNSAYTVYNDKQMQSDYNDYEDKIDDWEEKISDMEDSYYKKFSEMETALAKLQSTTSSLSSLLGS